jgi:hypothetical protein
MTFIGAPPKSLPRPPLRILANMAGSGGGAGLGWGTAGIIAANVGEHNTEPNTSSHRPTPGSRFPNPVSPALFSPTLPILSGFFAMPPSGSRALGDLHSACQ